MLVGDEADDCVGDVGGVAGSGEDGATTVGEGTGAERPGGAGTEGATAVTRRRRGPAAGGEAGTEGVVKGGAKSPC